LFIFLAKVFDYDLRDLRRVTRTGEIMKKLVPIVNGLRGILVREVKEGKNQETATLDSGLDQFRKPDRMRDADYTEYPQQKIEEIKSLIINSSCSDDIKILFRSKDK